MKLPQNAHVAVLDGRQFQLYRNIGQADAIKLEALDTGDISDTNKSGGGRDHDATRDGASGQELEEIAHGAGVAEYLNARVLNHKIEALLIIADPDTLGEMRHHYHKELEGVLIGEINKTLTNSPVADIIRSIEAA